MFGRKAGFCITYEYGCLAISSGGDVFLDQIRKRNQLWNKFVEIEREHRGQVRTIIGNPEDESQILDLKQEQQAIYDEIKDMRKKARRGNVDIKEKSERAKELKTQIKELSKEAKEHRKAKADELRPLLDKLEQERNEVVKKAQAESGLYWGNYEDVRYAYENARKKAMREGKELKFHRFNGNGEVSIRYQFGLPIEEVFVCKDGRLQIESVSVDAWEHPVRAVRRKAARTIVRIRAASDENKKPLWVELPMVMHRALPPGRIKQASIACEKIFCKYRYKLLLVVELDKIPVEQTDNNRVVAIDIGWRKVAEGIRVAYWKDEKGNKDQVVIPESTVGQFRKLNDLKSICDNDFNEAKTAVQQWLSGNEVPEGLMQATSHISQCRDHGRLLRLLKEWLENRVSGDEEVIKMLQCWRSKWQHLKSWETHARDQLGRHRREIYRKFAHKLIQEYDTVVLEDFDLRSMARKKSPVDGTQGSMPADYQRTIAATSVLRNTIYQACRREGINTIKLDPAYTTMRCSVCDKIEEFDAAVNMFHKCSNGHFWDIDENACDNLLQDFRKREGFPDKNTPFEN